ncbi:hypothetical protein [Chitinophaga sp. 22620]|uniref:hypothetical protein n=1 Tax=Chitinophaga sp. 22620 TaxID=3453952 RepID=UPI003F84C998
MTIKTRHCEKRRSQSGRGDEAISFIKLIYSKLLADGFVVPPAQNPPLLLAMMGLCSAKGRKTPVAPAFLLFFWKHYLFIFEDSIPADIPLS